jgi:hypothetical protein
MRRRSGLLCGAGLMALACSAVAVPATASSVTAPSVRHVASAPAAVLGSWGAAQEVPGTAALNVSGAGIDAMSCPSAGYCSAAGTYEDATGTQGFTVDETAGIWGTAQELPDLAALNIGGSAQVRSLSCSSAGNCALGGSYSDETDGGTAQAFVANEIGGVWGPAIEVPGTAALNSTLMASVTSVSCATDGYCSAGGFYTNSFDTPLDFVVDETAGVWGTAQQIPGTNYLISGGYTNLYSVSCGSPGNCVAVGSFGNEVYGFVQGLAFESDETAGVWGMAQLIPGSPSTENVSGAASTAVSCPAPGNCTAGGVYADNASPALTLFGVTETDGNWGTAVDLPVPGASGNLNVSSISCPSTGNCAMGGQPGFLVDETHGAWGKAITVPGLPSDAAANVQVNSVSCGSPGNCSAAGSYHTTDGQQAFVVEETGGTWEKAQPVPGIAALNSGRAASVTSVSCGAPATCGAGGYYTDSHGITQAFVVDETPDSVTRTALSRTASKVTYGNEQAERFRFEVTSEATVTSGTVTVTSGGHTVCVSKVGATGSGSCSPAATRFPAGAVSAVATYGGAFGLAPSSSGTINLKVTRATSRTGLALSAARIGYGHEQAERLTVTVYPRYGGTPGGHVTIKAGSAVLCVVKLTSGKGSCRLAASKLKAATYHLVADYGGSAGFGSSVSAAKTLTVVP